MKCASAIAAILCATGSCLGHDMMFVGQDASGRLHVFIEDELLPNMMPQSIFPEISGWVQTEFGFESQDFADPDNGIFPISDLADIEFVLISTDEGIEVLKDNFAGPLAIGEGYPLGHPFFHQHPLWHIFDVDFDKLYAMSFVLHDKSGLYPDSEPFTLTFGAIPCPADFDRSAFVDLDDFGSFVVAFEEGVDAADFDQSGFVDTDDFDGFVRAFEAGC